jgi:hypothetical protein
VDGNVLGGIRLTGIFKIISDSLDDIPVSSRLALAISKRRDDVNVRVFMNAGNLGMMVLRTSSIMVLEEAEDVSGTAETRVPEVTSRSGFLQSDVPSSGDTTLREIEICRESDSIKNGQAGVDTAWPLLCFVPQAHTYKSAISVEHTDN